MSIELRTRSRNAPSWCSTGTAVSAVTGSNDGAAPRGTGSITSPTSRLPPDILKFRARNFENAVQFIERDGFVTSGADYVFRALGICAQKKRGHGIAESLAGLPRNGPRVIYRLVADNRPFFRYLRGCFLSAPPGRPTYFVARWIFMRLLGAIYLVAFVSLLTQIGGLSGSHGIVPAVDFLQAVKEHAGAGRYWDYPTICWLGTNDGFLNSMRIAGRCFPSCHPRFFSLSICLFLLWVSIFRSARFARHSHFQWDILLLQTGFLRDLYGAVGHAARLENGIRRLAGGKVAFAVAFVLLLGMFESGAVKLTSGDDSWQDLTALTPHHYQTQPLPIWTSWYKNQGPLWFESLFGDGDVLRRAIRAIFHFAKAAIDAQGRGLSDDDRLPTHHRRHGKLLFFQCTDDCALPVVAG